MALKRLWSYIGSFILGLAYFLIYFMVHPLVVSTSLLPVLEVCNLISACILIGAFLIKDSLDETKIRKVSPPIGPSWIEHGPFAIMVLLQLLISLSITTDYTIVIMKIILSILYLVDIGWDLGQDVRSRSFHKK